MASAAGAPKPLVLHVVGQMAPGPAQLEIITLLKYRHQLRFDPLVLCLRRAGVWANRVKELGGVLLTQWTHPRWHPWYIYRLANVIRQIAPAAMHVHGFNSILPALTARRWAGRMPAVIQIDRDDIFLRRKRPKLLEAYERRCSCEADVLITTSALALPRIRQFIEQSPRKHGKPPLLHFPIGIDVDAIHGTQPHDPRPAWGLPALSPLIIYIEQHPRSRWNQIFTSAAALFRGGNPTGIPKDHSNTPIFVQVPDPMKEPDAKACFAARERKPAPTELDGPRLFTAESRRQLFSWLSHAEVVVLSVDNLVERTLALECMATGVPIILLGGGPLQGLVQDNVHALIVREPDAKALLERIKLLLHGPKLAQQLTTAALEFAHQYDAQHLARRYDELYANIIGQCGANKK